MTQNIYPGVDHTSSQRHVMSIMAQWMTIGQWTRKTFGL